LIATSNGAGSVSGYWLLLILCGAALYYDWQKRKRLDSEKISQAQVNRQNIFSWKVSGEELKYQVENYDKLTITESYRGIAAIIISALIGLSVLLYYILGFYSPDIGVAIELLIYLVGAILIYKKGYRWAIIGVMILWTMDKAAQMYDVVSSGQSVGWLGIIIWWFILMPYLYKALKVENARRKKSVATRQANKGSFCSKCGNALDDDSVFCAKCGAKVGITA
jgi:hypothetical protein